MGKRKLLHNLEDMNAMLEEGSCLLYGAGRVARSIVKYASPKGYAVAGILVSDTGRNPSSVMGVPVYALKGYPGELRNSRLIVATLEEAHGELEAVLSGYHLEEIAYMSDLLFQKITYQMGDVGLDCLNELAGINREMKAREKRMLRFVPRPCLEYMVLNILDHCNLRCKGCDHFSCIADPYFVSPETVHRDLDRLSEILHGDYVMRIAVMGGEPLLHPDLLGILRDVREHFPYTAIRLTTNGLLLLNQKEDFWRTCRDYRVTIVNTKYPISLDFDKIKEKADREGVSFQFFEGTGGARIKKSFKKRIDLNGDNNPVESFANCHISNYGNFLMEGKLYGCPFSCQSHRIFNRKFHQDLRMTENDFLDIYQVKDMQEIFDFAARPKFYCRYCTGLSEEFDWERSRGEMGEWVDGEGL